MGILGVLLKNSKGTVFAGGIWGLGRPTGWGEGGNCKLKKKLVHSIEHSIIWYTIINVVE